MPDEKRPIGRRDTDRNVFQYPPDNPKNANPYDPSDSWYNNEDICVVDSSFTHTISGKNMVYCDERKPKFGNALKKLFPNED